MLIIARLSREEERVQGVHAASSNHLETLSVVAETTSAGSDVLVVGLKNIHE